MTYILNKSLKMKGAGEPELFMPGQPCGHKCEKCEVNLNLGCNEGKKVQNDCMHCAEKQAVRIAKDKYGWRSKYSFFAGIMSLESLESTLINIPMRKSAP